MKAMIFAAGLGTRLKPFTDHAPKALAEVNGRSLLEHNVRYLQRVGIYEVVINVHHFADQIEEAIADNDAYGSEIAISDETDMLLETGGGLKKAAHYFAGETDLVVMNVDILTNLDLGKMIDAHKASDVMATLAVMQRESSRQLLFDGGMQLCGWQNNANGQQKIARDIAGTTPYSFSGIQVVSGQLLEDMPFEGKFSMIDVYLYHAAKNTVKGYDHTGNLFIDVGKPGSVEQAEYLFS
ncbi:nucleotidyltransferase family protein [Nemorincola caseinilytica]